MTLKNNREWVGDAIARNRVPLSGADKFWFWLNPSLVIGLACFLFYRNDVAGPALVTAGGWRPIDAPGFHLFLGFLIVIGGFMVYKNFQLFKLTKFDSVRLLAEKKKIIMRLKDSLGWQSEEHQSGFARFYAPRTLTHSPQVITVLFDESGYYVSCLDARRKTLEWGRGRRITVKVIEKIRELESD